MSLPLDRKLLVVSGKGGVGKTTIASAIGLMAARSGRRTVVVELGRESRVPGLFGLEASELGVETRLTERLSCLSIDPDGALLEWLQALGGRVSGRLLASSGTFQYFAAAAPGARELVSMIKIWRLTGGGRRGRRGAHELVVLDAPATGHALGLLGSPRTFGEIARVGPIASDTKEVRALLESPEHSAYVAVALGTETAVTEVLELRDGLRAQLGRDLDAVVLNALLPRRFTPAELELMGRLERSDGGPVTLAAVRAARAIHDRARFQHNQLARLRRRSFDVLAVPFCWRAQLQEAELSAIAERLARAI